MMSGYKLREVLLPWMVDKCERLLTLSGLNESLWWVGREEFQYGVWLTMRRESSALGGLSEECLPF